MMVKLRGDPWEALFPHALTLMEEVKTHGGIEPLWTFGGGTVLMLRYDHRMSKDIDIFVPDPQYLGFVTPRLSDVAEAIISDYVEQGNFVKLVLDSGEVDFVASPNLTDDPFEVWEIMGRPVRVETATEIVAKKLYHRGTGRPHATCSTWLLLSNRIATRSRAQRRSCYDTQPRSWTRSLDGARSLKSNSRRSSGGNSPGATTTV